MTIQEILSLCRKPGRYIGREKNAYHKPWESVPVRTACIFPDLYEIGMSHLGLQILYDIINRLSWALSDRVYCPDTDMEGLLRHHNMPLFGLETRRPLSDFDCLFITLPYELCYSNIFTILDLSGIPFFHRERDGDSWPLIVGGGSCCLNPEPVADLFDAIVIGDGEEVVVEILEVLGRSGKKDRANGELLQDLSSIPGIYIPSCYQPAYGRGKRFEGMECRDGDEKRVRRRLIPELKKSFSPVFPLVPNVQVVHDRLGVEIARGCTRGCRYCQASTIYRPVRERDLDDILSITAQGLDATGWEEISLLSLSTGDYTAIAPLILELMDTYVSKNISVSLPSLRVGTLTPEIMEQIRRVRKTGFTLAPEAGSDRLRMVINKGIAEEDLLDTAASIGARGWNSVKLYFMIGLPTETDEDIMEIVSLAKKVLKAISSSQGKKRGARVTVSVGTFVPKPHTPFQWEAQISVAESRRRIGLIKDGLRGKQFQVKWHDPVQSFLEGIFSRGDRKLSALIHAAWQKGARLDAWTDNLCPEYYGQAAHELDIDLESYLQAIPEDACLPWDHIDSGVKKAFFRLERKRALRLQYTPDCRTNDCQGCGVCDFKDIKPVLAQYKKDRPALSQGSLEKRPDIQPIYCAVSFSRVFDARFLGHLDMVRMFLRAIRRAGLPVAYSQGFHPMPRVSFSQPIPLGMECLRQSAVLVLNEAMKAGEVTQRLNKELPLGIKVKDVEISRTKIKIMPDSRESFLILLRDISQEVAQARIESFLRSSEFYLDVEKKGRKISLDLSKRVETIKQISIQEIDDDQEMYWAKEVLKQVSSTQNSLLRMEILQESPHIKPSDALVGMFQLSSSHMLLARILKI